MDSVEYYKSLISDEEVIKALLKESKAREEGGAKAKTRVRPNLNFFQRTVTNLVSSNKRIPAAQTDIFKEKPEKASTAERRRSHHKVKTPCAIVKEILLSNRINFVKAGELKVVNLATTDSCVSANPKQNDEIVSNSPKKDFDTSLNLRAHKSKRCSASTSASKRKKRTLHLTECSDSTISISSSDVTSSQSSPKSEVICLSDTDSDVILLDSPERSSKRTKAGTHKGGKKRCTRKKRS